MQNSFLRSIEKTLWPEYPIWGGRGGWQEGSGSGCLRCHTCSQVTMAHPQCIHTPGGCFAPAFSLSAALLLSIEEDS